MNEGKKDRRDPIRTIKARNPVAKNATSAIGGGAAGAHKDKKKAMKQGDVKHKKAEYAEHLAASLRKAVIENYNAQYDDEAGMADNNLHTLKNAVEGIDKIISAGDNLPEWCQEKIAVAEHMLVSVWDYMQGEQDSESDVSEASALEKFRKAASEREKKHNDAEKEMNARHARGEEDMKGSIDRLEKHVNTKEGLRDPKDNPCWKGYKPVGTKKKGGKTVPNCVPKEGWTHDSLAAELFETENTYEDRLSNLLNKQLGK
jgi:hypothetical protein